MSPTLANFLFEALNFLALAGALGWLLFRPIRNALNAERDRHARAQAELTSERAAAEALMTQAREAAARLDDELKAKRAEALAAVHEETARARDAAREQQVAQLQEFEQRGAVLQRAQAEQLAATVGRIAASSVRALLDALAGPSLDLALVRAACSELSTLREPERQHAVIESAAPLDAEARALLASHLGAPFQERLVQELGAGVRVTTKAGQIDCTAAALAAQAARQITALAASATVERGPAHDR
ncbi:MAG: hypothetical protein R3A51_19125 [Nannocystaceae bacterium]